ncbi:hypothetical protein BDV93DRAFT_526798 [Ceratobasidium sp. AG-I]|nr:hypothetical protein BDV93DRAFT_526798 [Ceratobasidium sp. AG-I]
MPKSRPAPPYHYITLQLAPPTERLALRHAIQKSLQRTFGITRAGVGIDVLTEEGVEVGGEEREVVVLRVASG